MARHYRKATYEVADDAWITVVAPINCDYFWLRNEGNAKILMRSDPYDPNTEDSLNAGAQDICAVIFKSEPGGGQRFKQGESVIYVRSTSGVQTLKATFVR